MVELIEIIKDMDECNFLIALLLFDNYYLDSLRIYTRILTQHLSWMNDNPQMKRHYLYI